MIYFPYPAMYSLSELMDAFIIVNMPYSERLTSKFVHSFIVYLFWSSSVRVCKKYLRWACYIWIRNTLMLSEGSEKELLKLNSEVSNNKNYGDI